MLATILSGLVPAILSARGNAAEMMKEGGRGNSSRLVNVITRVLVIGQIALTAALLIGATLQIKSIRNQTSQNYGYDEHALYSARMGLMEGDYPTDDAKHQFFVRALHSLRANPAFEGAAMTDRFRMTFAILDVRSRCQTYVTIGSPRATPNPSSDASFTTLGLKLLEGRDFTIEDSDAKRRSRS